MFHCPVRVWVIEQHAMISSATVRSLLWDMGLVYWGICDFWSFGMGSVFKAVDWWPPLFYVHVITYQYRNTDAGLAKPLRRRDPEKWHKD